MYRFVQKIQKKDDKQKRAILVLLTAASTVVVGGAWLFMLQNRLSNERAFVGPSITRQQEEKEEERVAIDIERPFDSLKETTVNGFAAIKSQFDELKNGTGSQIDSSESSPEESSAWELPTESQ